MLLRSTLGWSNMTFLSRSRSTKKSIRDQKSIHATLIAEFVNSARLSAVVASMATARRLGLQLRFPGAFCAYLPPIPYVYQSVCATVTSGSLRGDCVASLHEYYSRLAFVTALSDLPADEWRFGAALTRADWQALEDAWCQVCALASVAMHHMIEVSLDLDDFSPRPLHLVQGIVATAKDGGRPCVDSDGAVFVPGWLQRRHRERAILNWPVFLEVNGRREQSTLHDISASGMGLSDCRVHPVGSEVIVHLLSGRRLVGRVQWSRQDRLGALLSPPLAQDDPLLVNIYSVA